MPTKQEKFKEQAVKKVESACRALRAVGNLSGPGYEYDEEQVKEMFGYIRERMETERARFCVQAGFRFQGNGQHDEASQDDQESPGDLAQDSAT